MTGYLGLLLLGGSFISIGLFFSSLTRNQIVAGVHHVRDASAAVGDQLGRRIGRAGAARRAVGAVDHRSLRRLLEGRHRHQARHLLPVVHHVRAVPDARSRSTASGGAGNPVRRRTSQRRDSQCSRLDRHRRSSSPPSPSGSSRPEQQQVWQGLALAGLVCVLLYLLSQWREIAGTVPGRQARYGALSSASVLLVLGDPRRHQLHRRPSEQALGSHRGRQFTLSDQTAQGPGRAEGSR